MDALTSLYLDMPNLVDMTCSHIPSSSCSAILPLVTTQSLRANYLQEIDFFAREQAGRALVAMFAENNNSNHRNNDSSRQQ